MEVGQITVDDYAATMREAKKTGKSLHEILLTQGKVTVDELVQALAIHMDITFLKEALGIDSSSDQPKRTSRPMGSYLERISLLFKTGILISAETSVNSLVELLIREAPSVMNAERATIFLADYDKKELYSHVGVGLKQDQIRIPWETGIAGWVFTQGEALNIADPYEDPRFNRGVDSKTGFKTTNLLCVPLRAPSGRILGVFQVLNKRAGVFTSMDQEILEILAGQAARSIENVLQVDNLTPGLRLEQSGDGAAGSPFEQEDPLERIVGASKAIQEVRSLVQRVAPTETTVLIQGESGTGKELVARAIHRLGSRADGPLITLNCAAIPSELIESELFGHRKGAFTGAVQDSKGVFRSAHMGTLFLDEIEAMEPAMQVKLLRAIQSGEIKPVGLNVTHTVDVRLIAATNQNLYEKVSEGTFREDLFYRVNVFPITIPPLRDRIEDIPALVKHFLEKMSLQTGKGVWGIDPAALDLLMRYPWPGNVRELENEIERAQVLTGDGRNISVRRLSPKITRHLEKVAAQSPSAKPRTLKEAVEDLERTVIQEALKRHDGNRTLVAKRLGLSRQGLLNKLYKYGFAEK